jgi:hypothetical protein
MKMQGGRGVSGFHIDGRSCYLETDVGRCSIYDNKVMPTPYGGTVVDIGRDVRHEKRIETDDLGPIKIRRRRLNSDLPKTLGELAVFLSGSESAVVLVQTSDGRPSTMELVRLAGDGDEGAEEELFNRGTAAREELIAKARDPRCRKHHPTIAWLLLTCFASPETRSSVEDMFDREKDPKRKEQLAMLLGSTSL